MTLDAGSQPPVGVANPAKIEFFVGTPPRRMVIFSGVAVTNFRADDEDNVAWEDVVVRLGDTTTENFTYTSTVGLASLSCCDDSNFNVFADTSRVDADPLTAELLLHVPLVVSGDPGESRQAYRWSCEVSVYLERGRRRTGGGRALYDALFLRLAERGFRTAVAGMTLPNDGSVGLHHAMGFEPVGTLRRIGWKHNAWHDVAWAQRTIATGQDPPADPR